MCIKNTNNIQIQKHYHYMSSESEIALSLLSPIDVIGWEKRQRKMIFNENKIHWKPKTCCVILHKYEFLWSQLSSLVEKRDKGKKIIENLNLVSIVIQLIGS